MKKFRVSVSWTQVETFYIEAESEEEAREIADHMDLTDKGEYLCDSFHIDNVEEEETW